MRRKKILFRQRVEAYSLICTISTKLFGEDTISKGDMLDLEIRLFSDHDSYHNKLPDTIFLVIASSDFFEPFHEEDEVVRTHIFEFDNSTLCQREYLKVWLTILAKQDVSACLGRGLLKHSVDKSVNLKLFTSSAQAKRYVEEIGAKVYKRR